MFWFKKKDAESASGSSNAESSEGGDGEAVKPAVSGNIEIELTRIKSQLEALNEVRKANGEQFTRLSEQIGELRSAIMDSNKSISTIEIASTKAIDMVNSVQPDKLMIEVRKSDGKVESLRANIEANEAMMKDIMKEMKEMREKMNFYKGVEQVVKLNDEIKQELIDVKRTEGIVGKHADRVETIFIEVEKKFYDFEKFNETVKEIDRSFKRLSSDFDKMRVGVEEKADKKEFVKLVDKFADFEKHTGAIIKLLDQKSKTTTVELNELFTKLKTQLERKYATKLDVGGLKEGQDASATNTSASTATPVTANSTTAVPPSSVVPPATSSVGTADGSNTATPIASPVADTAEKKVNIFGFLKK